MSIWKRSILFCLGGGGYVLLELLWRGWSHFSMFLAGGLSFLLVGHLEEVEPRLPLWLRIPVGVGFITMVELAAGLIFNRSYRVWDYRGLPGNFLGQICPQFCLLWIPVAALALWLYKKAAGWLE